MALIGEVIDGKYEVLKEIGRGGMSIVYLASDKRLNKQWAIKEFKKGKDELNLKSLKREARIMKNLDHPRLPRVVDIIESNDTLLLIMDYVQGETLDSLLKSDTYKGKGFPQESVIEWAKQLSEVLAYLHKQDPPVIYRDMKPGNIMLRPEGDVTLIDFGIAKEYKENKGDTELMGTKGYAPPEAYVTGATTDPKSDIYSLGVTLHYLITGVDPTENVTLNPIRQYNPSLSSALEWVINKCVQNNPDERFHSCDELSAVLENLDKYEDSYKKKQKVRIRLFTVFAVLTVVFGAIGAGSLWGRSAAISSSYEELVALETLDGYEQAIELDEDNPEAYAECVNMLVNKGYKVLDNEDDSADGTDGEYISVPKLTDLFGTEKLNTFKDDSKYAVVNYQLGKLIWNSLQKDTSEDSSVDPKSVAEFAIIYFKNVINVSGNGLPLKTYNIAQAYYWESYFLTNNELLKSEDGLAEIDNKDKFVEFIESNENYEDGHDDDPYYLYFMANDMLLDLVDTDSDEIDNTTKGETASKLVNILSENYSYFCSSLKSTNNGEELMQNYIGQLYEVLSSISTENADKKLTDAVSNAVETLGYSNEEGKVLGYSDGTGLTRNIRLKFESLSKNSTDSETSTEGDAQ